MFRQNDPPGMTGTTKQGQAIYERHSENQAHDMGNSLDPAGAEEVARTGNARLLETATASQVNTPLQGRSSV